MMSASNMAAPCGAYCAHCEYLDEGCVGCKVHEGKPVWVKDTGFEVCKLYECAVAKKGYAHCGECKQLPCDMFVRYTDPGMSEEQARKDVEMRVSRLKRWREIGVDAWLFEQQSGC